MDPNSPLIQGSQGSQASSRSNAGTATHGSKIISFLLSPLKHTVQLSSVKRKWACLGTRKTYFDMENNLGYAD